VGLREMMDARFWSCDGFTTSFFCFVLFPDMFSFLFFLSFFFDCSACGFCALGIYCPFQRDMIDTKIPLPFFYHAFLRC
jgi:hypothetical protein